MAYLDSLAQCVGTLEQCNDNLHSMTSSLSSLTQTFPRVETVIRCEKKYDLTTASDINKAQTLISKEAVPFLFRQVDQLENAVEAIRVAYETLSQKVDDQKDEYEQLVANEELLSEVQKSLKVEQAALSDEQANLLNAKSLVAAKERDLAELNRVRSTTRNKSTVLEEASKVDAEIIKIRRIIAEVEHETMAIPTDDQIRDTEDGSDNYLVLDRLREQLALLPEISVDNEAATFIDSAMDTLELLENKVFVPWWDGNTNIQTERMRYLTRLLRYFYKEHGSTMHAVIETLLDHQSMTIDDLRKDLASTGHATTDLPLLINHLKKIGAVVTDTIVVGGKQVMAVQLDFNGLADDEYDEDVVMGDEDKAAA
ncbi:hypothetical protein COEREDRAFT_8034 [Coemansia reversa NRRL 1564]|uniref:DASH complex subunit SPC19 n=1 Tax=Coemansia reversa (strain ATCC 12441 / NRRL 1564) TaxID=763665 RepID=A0A2G5BCZ4_COERN|nr:hypothetical protein COEREDRAFT_8034 [Coemansia reversa NRRL 1564]|eukprot:PIA16888.1 hypothetical protein COEREDRAFT_8034 [Coemansia reversa NRRL 1564]